MKDIKIDFENKKLLNQTVEGKDRIIQQIKVAVRTWINDFFLNEAFGVDYINCWTNLTLLELYVREQVEAISGIFSAQKVSVEKVKDIGGLDYIKVDIGIIYEDDEITVTERIMGR